MAKKKTFKQLQKEWYAKIAKVKDEIYPEGFTDAEDTNGNLKEWSSRAWRNNEHENMQDTVESKRNYYDLATRFLNEYQFESNLDKIVWEYHVEGVSYRNIVKLLAKVNIHTNRDVINKLVMRLKQTMKDKYLL